MTTAAFKFRRRIGDKQAERARQYGDDIDAVYIGKEQHVMGSGAIAAEAVLPYKNGTFYHVFNQYGYPVACIFVGEMGTGGSKFLNKLVSLGAFNNENLCKNDGPDADQGTVSSVP